MGIEYRIETYDFDRAHVAQKLRNRSFVVRDTSQGLAIWETEPAEGISNVELRAGQGSVTMVVHGGKAAFSERVVGVVLMAMAAEGERVVFSEL